MKKITYLLLICNIVVFLILISDFIIRCKDLNLKTITKINKKVPEFKSSNDELLDLISEYKKEIKSENKNDNL